MLQRHLALSYALGHAAVARVEALESRAPVVVSVGVVEVEQQVAAQLYLVGRVVGEEPRRGRVAQADHEQRGRRGQQQPDGKHQSDRESPRPGPRAGDEADGGGSAEEARQEGAGSRDAKVVFLARRPDKWSERALGIDGPGPEGPGVGAQLGQVDRNEQEQDAHERPGAPLAELLPHGAVAERRRERSAAGRWASRQVSQPAATPSTSQVMGSSRNPL